MSHSVYLYYKNKKLEDESFQFTVQIPFLWQEMYDLDLIENQENKILEGLSRNQNNADAHLIIPVEKAIRNLKIKSKLFTSEKDDKKKLRIDFLNFIKENVDKTSDFEINFFELKDLYVSLEDLMKDLKSFHTDRKKELRYQREPVSFRAIGYNENFKAHSKIYQSLLEEEEKNSSINWERHQKAIRKRTISQTKTDSLESVFLSLIIIGLISIGLLLMFIRYDYILGVLFIIIGILVYFFNRTKIKFKKQT